MKTVTYDDIETLRKGLRDWETPENRYAAQRVLDKIAAAHSGDAATRINELESLLQKAAQGLRFRSQYTNGDPVLDELWAYMTQHYPQYEGRMSGWASMRDNWQTTSGPHCYGCLCQTCRDARKEPK